MYLDYFGLEREPFTISPDPAFLYPSPQHRQALAHLKYGLDREGGFILLTGEVGTGKTTLTRLLLEQLPGNVRVAYILNAKLNSRDVLASVCSELHLEYPSDSSDKALTDLIYKDLLASHSLGKKTLLVLEEAQNLEPDVLETLRLLTNLETNTTKLLHILLVGQPELLDLIARNELRQLNQRVVSRFHIEPLSLAETGNYLVHRLRRAGGKKHPFEQAAVRTLHQLSGGIPRMLNLISERSLLGAYATGTHEVTPAIVQAAYKEVFGEAVEDVAEKKSGGAIAATILVCLIAVVGYFGYQNFYSFTEADGSADNLVQTQQSPPKQEIAQQVPKTDAEILVISEENLAQEEEFNAAAMSVGEVLMPLPQETPAESEIETEDSAQTTASRETENAYQQLLKIWAVEADFKNQQQFCERAKEYGLLCQQEDSLSYEDLLLINRPGLALMAETQESSVLYLLANIDALEATLSNSSGEKRLPLELFQQQWSGDFLYLWRPPAAYESLLYPGTSNPELVNWLQIQLSKIYSSYELLLVGGVYSEPISNYVSEFQRSQGLNPDGLLGPRTILRLMDQTEDLPRLLDTGPETNESLDEVVYN